MYAHCPQRKHAIDAKPTAQGRPADAERLAWIEELLGLAVSLALRAVEDVLAFEGHHVGIVLS